MPTQIYKTKIITTIDNFEIEVIPLKIKYLRQLMEVFKEIEPTTDQDAILGIFGKCALIAMKQYVPGMFNSVEEIEDNFDVQAVYDILKYAAGIDVRASAETQSEKQKEKKDDGATWESLDLVKLESEAFLLGIWKNFDELESSISIEELMQILSTTRELDYEEKKFLAALQGVDLDESSDQERGQKEWENLKARVASGGATNDSKDILALQGANARQAGFGIGLGLSYDDQRDPSVLVKK